LFDPSKEMVFITMSKEEKEAGKAAVDVLGNQIGKTGGSWLMQVRAGAYRMAVLRETPHNAHVHDTSARRLRLELTSSVHSGCAQG
jgi:ATP/ADP translocase